MKPETTKELEKLARDLVAGDYAVAGEILAPWLEIGALETAIEQQVAATRAMWSDENLGIADSWEIDDSPVTLSELREE